MDKESNENWLLRMLDNGMIQVADKATQDRLNDMAKIADASVILTDAIKLMAEVRRELDGGQ